MAVLELNLQNLLHLDGGRVNESFNQLMKRAATDCDDRPGLDKPRKVILQCSLVPICDEAGNLVDIHTSFQLKETEPDRKTKSYSVGYRKMGNTNLVFNDLSDDNINQGTLPFDGEDQ